MLNLGFVVPGTTLNIPFNTYSSDDPAASMTITTLAVTDIQIYKDGSITQRASTSGYAVDTDLDAIVGVHSIQIDLADNTTAGFFSAGSEYVVVVQTVTLDGASVSAAIARFTIGYPTAIINTTIATLSTQTSFTLTNGPAEADALNGMWCVIHDVASRVQLGYAVITDYAVTTKTVTLAAGVPFTAAATDNIAIMGPAPLQATVPNRTLGVESDGDLTKVNTLDGHTAQTGDSFARLGAPAGASVSADLAAIEAQTDDIGVAGAGLTALATAAALATVDANVDAILVDTGTTLETHLTDIKGATFSGTTDSLEAIRDRGDAAWTTGAGGSDRLLMVDTTIATLASQTSFTLNAGSADDNAYNNCTIVIEDVATATQKAVGLISAYTGATKTVTLKYDPGVFTMAATDKVYVLAENALKSTDANRQLDVTATGAAGIDWGNVENPTTAVDLSATDIQLVDTVTTYTGNTPQTGDSFVRLPAALVGGRMDSSVGAMAADVITAAAIATDAIGAAELAADAVAEIADAVWDEAIAGHLGAGSTGLNLNDAGAAGDPWSTALPGAYGAGTAGKIVGDNINAPIATVDTVVDGIQTDLDNATDGLGALKTLIDTVDTVVDAIKAVTDLLPDAGALTTIGTDTARLTAVRAAILTDWIDGGRLDLLLDAIPTTAMRGTDSAALASVCTEARLAELSAANLPADLDAVKVITDALGATAAANLALACGAAGVVVGAAEAGTLSTTQMTTDLAEATDDHYIGRVVVWTAGVLAGQATDITDYAGATGLLTYTAVTDAPSAGDGFIIV